GQQRIPVPAPDHLDDVPAGTTEIRLQLLDDLAVTADRSVQALQVAVDDEREVVELLPRGDTDRADRFDFVHLTVAEERPYVRVGCIRDSARRQVPVE